MIFLSAASNNKQPEEGENENQYLNKQTYFPFYQKTKLKQNEKKN